MSKSPATGFFTSLLFGCDTNCKMIALQALTSLYKEYGPELVISCTCLVLLLLVHRRQTSPLYTVPGPWFSSWTDLPLRIRILLANKAQYVHSLHQKYGPIVRLGPNDIDVCDYRSVRAIHRVRNPFLKSAFYGPGVGLQSLFSTRDPGFHSKRRRLFGPYFTEAHLNTMEPVVQRFAEEAVRKMVNEAREQGTVDILKWWTLMAMDVIGELSLGESFDMVKSGKKNQFAEDVALAGSILPLRTAFPAVLAWASYMPFTSYFRNIAESRQRILSAQKKRVIRFLDEQNTSVAPERKSLLGLLVKNEPEYDLATIDLTIEVQSFITAGTDTTAVTLTYLIWAICRHDNVRDKLLAELSQLPDDFHHHSLRDLTYLNCVINEGLRCYGAAPGALPRVVPSEGVTLGDYFIPGDVVVSTQSYSIHRDPEIFPDPEQFDPSRWLEPTKLMTDAFMPFGIGPRSCIGVHLARMELRLGVALFFHHAPSAEISTAHGMTDKDMDCDISFLLIPSGHRCLVEV